MKTQTLIFSFMVLATLAGLIWLAVGGSILAVVVLSIVTPILVFMTGAMVAVYVVRVMTDKAQQDFMDNAQENLSIMKQLQNIQNQQNTQLLKQVKQLPQPKDNGYKPIFEIDDTVFEELEK